MSWRRLRPGELDHELIWLVVSIAAAFLAALWLLSGLPTPICFFHQLTGWACPTCGITRCLRYLLAGQLQHAFLVNPLGFCAILIGICANAYAAAVLLTSSPRWRPRKVSVPTARLLRILIIGAILVNWAWLLWRL